jgi:hypothetical protein
MKKDEAHAARYESGERASGETFCQQTMDRALDRRGQDQGLQEACRVTHRQQGGTFRGHVPGLQQADFSPGER